MIILVDGETLDSDNLRIWSEKAFTASCSFLGWHRCFRWLIPHTCAVPSGPFRKTCQHNPKIINGIRKTCIPRKMHDWPQMKITFSLHLCMAQMALNGKHPASRRCVIIFPKPRCGSGNMLHAAGCLFFHPCLRQRRSAAPWPLRECRTSKNNVAILKKYRHILCRGFLRIAPHE